MSYYFFRVTATYTINGLWSLQHVVHDTLYLTYILTVLLTSRNHCSGGKRAVNYTMEIKHSNIRCSIAVRYLYIYMSKNARVR